MSTKEEESVQLRKKQTHPKRQMARKILLFSSFLLFPITIFYFSPYLSIMGPVLGIISGAVIVFASLFIFSLLFGRIFCSWFCPMAGMLDAMATIRKRRILKRSFWVKWLVFIPWVLVIIVLPLVLMPGWQGFDIFWRIGDKLVINDSPLETFAMTGISIMSLQGIIIYYIIIIILAVLGFAVGKRSFCHHMCWVGPFMVIGRKISNWLRIPSLRLKPENENCIDCKRCTRKCPMSLSVNEFVQRGDMEDSNCILCGECIDECPKNVIHYTFTSHKNAKVAEVKIEK
ncbi:MAG: 4Fe-4S binding protein [Candidatus Heimdallarchaeota archaeon]|nr:MAG: 4Fe-4S binding protein [Candidatus Heimdallarchaeota archaeon]